MPVGLTPQKHPIRATRRAESRHGLIARTIP